MDNSPHQIRRDLSRFENLQRARKDGRIIEKRIRPSGGRHFYAQAGGDDWDGKITHPVTDYRITDG